MKLYLAHKFEKQAEALEIQKELEDLGFTILNPFQREEQARYDRAIAEGGHFDDQTCADIVHADLNLIDEADAVAAILSPNAIGTVMEIFYTGHVAEKPVVTWITYKLNYRHPWIAHYSIETYNRTEFVNAIKNLKA